MAGALNIMDENISFALLDLNVSDGPTHDVARRLRQRRIPVLFVSDGDQRDIPHDLTSIGFVRKPAHTQRLIERVKSMTIDFDIPN